MRFSTALLPLAAVAVSGFVIPDEQLIQQLQLDSKPESPSSGSFLSKLSDKTQHLVDQVETVLADVSRNVFEDAMSAAESVHDNGICLKTMTAFDGQGWLDSAADFFGHHGGKHGDHGDHGKHGKHPGKHHGHHYNRTVYQLINESNYTTKLASLINEYDDLVEALNGTAANYTIFAPTDKAFERVMKSHHKKPTKEEIKMILAYHVSAEFYPAGRVLVSHTIPTTFGEPHIDGNRQRLRVGLSLRGLTVNFYARIIAIDYFGSNGVIHAIDHVLLPPPRVGKVLQLLPAEFSTLILALEKTDLWSGFDKDHFTGGTLFAPSNWAFQKLGPRINMFLFSEHGKKYLKALLEYHAVPGITLYSDAVYYHKGDGDEDKDGQGEESERGSGRIPKGKFQIELPTLLEGRSISADIARFGGFIVMRLNGFNDVAIQDGIAQDGVIHRLDAVLLPPKAPGGAGLAVESEDDISLEEFKERLDGFYGEL